MIILKTILVLYIVSVIALLYVFYAGKYPKEGKIKLDALIEQRGAVLVYIVLTILLAVWPAVVISYKTLLDDN